jgi:hypothetical protein
MGRITQEKAKPVGRQGRKATGHYDSRVAEKVIWLFLRPDNKEKIL